MAVLGVVAAFRLVSARRALLRGSADVSAIGVVLHDGVSLRDTGQRRVVRSALRRAGAEFTAAHNDLWLWSPVLAHLGWVPGIGGQLAGAFPIADSAMHTTSAAILVLRGLDPVWPALAAHAGAPPLLARLAPALLQGHGSFVDGQREAQLAGAALLGAPASTGAVALDRDVARLRSSVAALQNSSRWLSVAPTLLGATVPAHYLLAWQDRRELRATGGYIGAADYVTIRHGIITTDPSGSAFPHEAPAPLPLPEAVYTNEGYWQFRDSNWSPDFPLTARFEQALYARDTGRSAPTVVDVLDRASADILRAAGPIFLRKYHRWVNQQNAEAVAQYYIYTMYRGPIDNAHDAVRKRFLGVFMRALLQRVQNLNIARLPALAAALSQAVSQQDIQLYDQRPEVETAFRSIGADGAMVHAPNDQIFIVDDNRSYNKLNSYVRETATYEAEVHADRWIDATLRLHYHVLPSPPNLEGVGPGYGTEGNKHDYQDFVRVYVPRGARLDSMTGVDSWAPSGAYGLTQFAGRLLLREGRTASVVIHYRVPPSVFSASGPQRYNLTVERQPGANISAVHVIVTGAGLGSKGRNRSVALDGRVAQLSVPLPGRAELGRAPAVPPPVSGDPYVSRSIFPARTRHR